MLNHRGHLSRPQRGGPSAPPPRGAPRGGPIFAKKDNIHAGYYLLAHFAAADPRRYPNILVARFDICALRLNLGSASKPGHQKSPAARAVSEKLHLDMGTVMSFWVAVTGPRPLTLRPPSAVTAPDP